MADFFIIRQEKNLPGFENLEGRGTGIKNALLFGKAKRFNTIQITQSISSFWCLFPYHRQ